MSTPNILFVAYQTARGSDGGVESATRIFEVLAKDFRWTLMTNRVTTRTERWRAGGARIVSFTFDDVASRPRRATQLLRLTSGTMREVLLHHHHIIHANDIRTAQATIPVARLTGKPFIYTVRDTKGPGEHYSRVWGQIARNADSVITLSSELGHFFTNRFDAPICKVKTINSIVDLDTFRPVDPLQRIALRAQLGITPEQKAIGIVGGVVNKKGQLEFLRHCLPVLLAKNSRVHLHLIGDHNPDSDSYARDCQDVASQRPLAGRVTFHSFTTPVHPWLQALECVAIPSRNEGLARCMIETMACGTPVVSFDVCSAREMLEQTGAGFVVPQGEFAEMGLAITRILRDPRLAGQMGDAGRRTAIRRFNGSLIADQWRQVYCDLSSSNCRHLSS